MACRLFGSKPLLEPMLAYCKLDSWEQISVKIESEFYYFHSRKCIWKCLLPKWRPFCLHRNYAHCLQLCHVYSVVPNRFSYIPLQWRNNGHDGVSNQQPRDCLLNRLLSLRSKKTSKLRVTGLCEGNSPVTGEFPSQRASNAENVSNLMTSSCLQGCFTGTGQ